MRKTPGFYCLILICLLCSQIKAQTDTKPAEDEFAEKKTEITLTEVVPTDSLPASELMKRAVVWIKEESPKYKKSSGVTTGTKAECVASFPIKPKELNPAVDYTGKITMKVVIECKNSKFRYTVSDIRHTSKNGRTTAGSMNNKTPECGSMVMDDTVWKKLKGEALRDAALVVSDLKIGMAVIAEETAKDDW